MSDENGPPEMQRDEVGASLAPQLGSDRNVLQKGSMDVRRLGVLDRQLIMSMIYAKIRMAQGSTTWFTVYDESLNLNISVGGRGRRDLIRETVANRGGGVNVESEINDKEPSWFARNVADRQWAEKRLKTQGESA